MEVERTQFFEFAFLEMLGDCGVGLELFNEIGVVASGVFDFPGFHGGVLHEFVGGFPGEAFADEREQHGLAVPHAQAQAEVALHVLWIDVQAVHEPGEQAEHVIQQRAGIGENNPLDG